MGSCLACGVPISGQPQWDLNIVFDRLPDSCGCFYVLHWISDESSNRVISSSLKPINIQGYPFERKKIFFKKFEIVQHSILEAAFGLHAYLSLLQLLPLFISPIVLFGLNDNRNWQILSSPIVFCSQQIQMKEDVIEQDTQEWQSNFSFTGLERVGGMDLSFLKEDATRACASLVVLSYPELEVTKINTEDITRNFLTSRINIKKTKTPSFPKFDYLP